MPSPLGCERSLRWESAAYTCPVDRGWRQTTIGAVVVASAAVVVAVRGVGASVEPVVELLPELLAAPAALFALRFGRHRALVAALLVVGLHLSWPLSGALTLVAGLNLVVLALVPDLRITHPAALLHLVAALASFALVGAVGIETLHLGGLSVPGSLPWPEAALGAAGAAAVVATWWRRGPFEATLPWLATAVALTRVPGIQEPTSSLLFSAAEAIVVIGLVEDGRRLAFHDRLTGLPNRRALDDQLRRLGGEFALAVVDVDRFKDFNDRWGHETGDQVLRMVATELDRTEGGSRAFRFGGEEFVVVFPGLTAREAAHHVDGVRITIADRGFAVRSTARPARKPKRRARAGDGRRVHVTVSIGLASPGARRPAPGDVLRAADRAMYRAKNAGRNRLVSA
jgi:diguanylate cyclase (GGDEF)-like protein